MTPDPLVVFSLSGVVMLALGILNLHLERQHSIAKSDVAQAMLHQMHESKHKQEADQASLEDAKAEVADANLEVAALKSLLESAQDDRDAAGRHVNEQTTLLMGYVHQLKHEVATLEQAQQDLQKGFEDEMALSKQLLDSNQILQRQLAQHQT